MFADLFTIGLLCRTADFAVYPFAVSFGSPPLAASRGVALAAPRRGDLIMPYLIRFGFLRFSVFKTQECD